jgi:hypothetical protein
MSTVVAPPSGAPTTTAERLVDPRGIRFAAAVTAIVLAVALLTSSAWLLAVQAFVFAIGGFGGLRFSPYGWVFRSLIAPRLGPPRQREPEPAPKFAQTVGFAFAVVGVIGYATGLGWLGLAATALAWVAAFLNAAFGFCMGCEFYLLFHRTFTSKGVIA